MQQDSKDNMDDWICEKLAKLTFLHDYDFSSEKKKKAQKKLGLRVFGFFEAIGYRLKTMVRKLCRVEWWKDSAMEKRRG